MPFTKISFLTRSSGKSAIEKLRIIDPAFFADLPIFQIDPVSIEDIKGSDLILHQREFPYDFDDYSSLIDYCSRNGVPIVYEIDDYLHGLPRNHSDRNSGVMARKLLSMYLAIHTSSLVTVTSETLRRQYEHLNSNIRVLPNFFDDRLFKLNSPQKKSQNEDSLRMLYMGGRTHQPDVEMIAPVLKLLLEEYGDRLHIHFLGLGAPTALQRFSTVTSDLANEYDYEEFATKLQMENADIVIAPLEDNIFNRCKSPIKFFEYSSLGVPGVFSRVQPYLEVVRHERDGFLADTLDEWEKYLRLLLSNPTLRFDMASQAQDTISATYLLSKNSWRWQELYEVTKKPPYGKHTGNLIKQVKEIDIQSEEVFLSLEQRLNETNLTLMNLEFECNALKAIINDMDTKRASLMTQLMDTETEKRILSDELITIKRSKAWKMAMFLRSARVKCLPSNGFLFKVLRKFFHWGKRRYQKIRSIKLIKTKTLIKNLPLVSVIIPIYDRTDLLIQSIDSILRQTHKNLEILLVCDGSPQETLAIVDEYARIYPKTIRIFRFKLNSGNAVKGRNKGIVEARGEYIAFHDSDDVAEPKRIEFSLDTMKKFGADVVYGAWRAIVDGSREMEIKNGDVFTSPDCDLEMLKRICVPCQSTVMAKTEALRAVGGLNSKMGYREDHELWLRLADAGYKFKADQRLLTNLRLHEGNLEIALKTNDKHWESLMLVEYKKPRSLMPKIGYLIPGTGISGGIAVICEHSNRLIERGYDVSLISQDNSTSIDWFPRVLSEIIPMEHIDDNFDILIATGWSTADTVWESPAKRKLYLVQSDETRFFNPEEPDKVKAQQTYMKDFEFLTVATWLRNWLLECFHKHALLIKNGLNEEIIYKVSPIIPKGDKLRVLLEGPIVIPFKGMKDAFAAVQDLDCEVWCVSSAGKPEPSWHCDRFFYQVPLIKMKEIYSSCDVILKMSRVESFCYPPLEMMACGGTAVIGRVTGIEEYARDGYNCLIVDQGDVDGAKTALQKLIDDRELLSVLKANGSQTAQGWSWTPSIDVLETIINN